MRRFRRFDIVEETSIFSPPKTFFLNPFFPPFAIVEDEFHHAFDLLEHSHPPHFPLDEFDAVVDLIRVDKTPSRTSTRRISRRVGSSELYLQTISDRVSELEIGLERLLKEEKARKKKQIGERKYTWTAEIEEPDEERKYKWTAGIKSGEDGSNVVEKSYKCTAQIKGKGKGGDCRPIERSYTVKVSTGGKPEKETKKKGDKVKEKGKKVGPTARIVEIEEPSRHGGVVLRQAFAKRAEKRNGKKKELSPQDAASLIQSSFRAYLIRRSQSLRALRELAIAKSKLKEIRSLFNNFSYRRRLSNNAEERQRFSEKIIVLLLTVDAIPGYDVMVRGAKKSMVEELEGMLDVVEPQEASGRSLSMRRRMFDMPDGTINKELAAGVAQVVQMLDQEQTSGSQSFDV
ncbi:hypothetical protein ABFS83_06G116200 [Erythranthe nasuta]